MLNYGSSVHKVVTMPMWSSVFPISSWINFTVSDLTLRSVIYFESMLVQGERLGPSFSLLQVEIQFSCVILTL
jgi:hypothetical protein